MVKHGVSSEMLHVLSVTLLSCGIRPHLPLWLPVYAGALDAHGHPQVDGGPARLLLPTITALLVSGASQGHAQGCQLMSGGARQLVPDTQGRGGLFRLCTGKEDRFRSCEVCVYLAGNTYVMITSQLR